MVSCVGKDNLHQSTSYGKVEPAPRAFHPCGTKGADIRRELARVTDFLLQIAHQLESHYSEQLGRYHNGTDDRQPDLWSDTDPPF